MSSQATKSTARKIPIARKVISVRFPIGVDTIYRAFSMEIAESLLVRISSIGSLRVIFFGKSLDVSPKTVFSFIPWDIAF